MCVSPHFACARKRTLRQQTWKGAGALHFHGEVCHAVATAHGHASSRRDVFALVLAGLDDRDASACAAVSKAWHARVWALRPERMERLRAGVDARTEWRVRDYNVKLDDWRVRRYASVVLCIFFGLGLTLAGMFVPVDTLNSALNVTGFTDQWCTLVRVDGQLVSKLQTSRTRCGGTNGITVYRNVYATFVAGDNITQYAAVSYPSQCIESGGVGGRSGARDAHNCLQSSVAASAPTLRRRRLAWAASPRPSRACSCSHPQCRTLSCPLPLPVSPLRWP